jgi:putative ABC transport system substrate-binding protein
MNDEKERERKRKRRRNLIIGAAVAVVVMVAVAGGLMLRARRAAKGKTFTIGIISYVSVLDPVIKGFKAEMTELGYVEGKNVTYIYNGVVEPNPQAVDAEIENLLVQDVDLLLSAGNLATSRAKQAVEGTDIPVVFGLAVDPVGEGLVESIAHPGGNLTGSQPTTQEPKALEWLVTIVPGANKVYLPYNPNDVVTLVILPEVEKAAAQLNVELVLDQVQSAEEAVAAIESLPEDVDAIFRIPSPTLDPINNELGQAAIQRGIPLGSAVSPDGAVLLSLGVDLFGMGTQAARLASQILAGAKPGDLPVETGEPSLSINLKTANAIGLDIPDNILRLADTVIR